MRFLVVDDSEMDRRLLTALLETQQDSSTGLYHQFEEAETLDRALDMLRNHEPYDAILLDLNLPDSEGETTFLNVYPIARPTPIVVYSGLDDIELTKRLIADGASDYITKMPGLKAKQILNVLIMAAQRSGYAIRVAQSHAEAVNNAERATQALVNVSAQGPESEQVGEEFKIPEASIHEHILEHQRALALSIDGLFQLVKLGLEKDAKQDEAINTSRVRQVSLEEAQKVLARDSVYIEEQQNRLEGDLKKLDKGTKLRLTLLGFMLVGGGAGLRDQAPILWEFLASFF